MSRDTQVGGRRRRKGGDPPPAGATETRLPPNKTFKVTKVLTDCLPTGPKHSTGTVTTGSEQTGWEMGGLSRVAPGTRTGGAWCGDTGLTGLPPGPISHRGSGRVPDSPRQGSPWGCVPLGSKLAARKGSGVWGSLSGSEQEGPWGFPRAPLPASSEPCCRHRQAPGTLPRGRPLLEEPCPRRLAGQPQGRAWSGHLSVQKQDARKQKWGPRLLEVLPATTPHPAPSASRSLRGPPRRGSTGVWGEHRAPKSIQMPEEAGQCPEAWLGVVGGHWPPSPRRLNSHSFPPGGAQAEVLLLVFYPSLEAWGVLVLLAATGAGAGQGHTPGAGGMKAGRRAASLSRPATVSRRPSEPADARSGLGPDPARGRDPQGAPLSMFQRQDRHGQGHPRVLALCAPGWGRSHRARQVAWEGGTGLQLPPDPLPWRKGEGPGVNH